MQALVPAGIPSNQGRRELILDRQSVYMSKGTRERCNKPHRRLEPWWAGNSLLLVVLVLSSQATNC